VYITVLILGDYPTINVKKINLCNERRKKDVTKKKQRKEETRCKINVLMQDIMASPMLRCIGQAMRE